MEQLPGELIWKGRFDQARGAVGAWSGRLHVGYVMPSDAGPFFIWRLVALPDHSPGGALLGSKVTRAGAIAALDRRWVRFLKRAGLRA